MYFKIEFISVNRTVQSWQLSEWVLQAFISKELNVHRLGLGRLDLLCCSCWRSKDPSEMHMKQWLEFRLLQGKQEEPPERV